MWRHEVRFLDTNTLTMVLDHLLKTSFLIQRLPFHLAQLSLQCNGLQVLNMCRLLTWNF